MESPPVRLVLLVLEETPLLLEVGVVRPAVAVAVAITV
jgi:hypothetical protein